MIIRVQHAWSAGFCSRGLREFAKKHDLDWEKFLNEGIEEEELLKFDDHMVNKIIEVAHGQQEESNDRI